MNYKYVRIPEGISGDWSIKHFTVSEDDARMFNLRQLINHTPNRSIDPGDYIKLCNNGYVVMSDTQAEKNDHHPIFYKAHSFNSLERPFTALINGLGLGYITQKLLEFNFLRSITVIEISEDVINLVAPYIKDSRLEIIHADALEYKPKDFYTLVWHDIWSGICIDNKPEYIKLNRKYGKKCHWQGSWCKREVYEREKVWW